MTSVANALAGGPRWVSPGHPFSPAELDTAPAEVSFVVTTSGSTGRPKGVMLRTDAVRASALATQQVLGDGAWVLALPAHFVAGLMVLVRGLVTDQPVRQVASDLSDLAPDGPTHLSLVPTQLIRALDDPDRTARLADCASVLLGGAPASPEVLDRARAAGVPVHTTYGMSETSGGCVYNGRPLPGVEVTIGTDDRIELTGPMTFDGYLADPEQTAEVLRGRTVRTQDRGRWRIDETGARQLEVLGRLDEVVISGGVNVDLAAVTRAADALPGPGEHLAFGVPDREWGTRVVLASTGNQSLAQLRAALADELPAAWLPRGLLRLDSLPRTERGKIDRQSLPQRWQHSDREVH